MNTLGRSSSRIVTADRRWRGRATVRQWPSGLVALVMVFALLQGVAWAAPPEGVWLIDEKVAIEIFDCSGLVCGRILWLKVPRNSLGELDRDKNNPDPSLRQAWLCGLTIFWGLRSGDQDRWTGGWFYNPDDG